MHWSRSRSGASRRMPKTLATARGGRRRRGAALPSVAADGRRRPSDAAAARPAVRQPPPPLLSVIGVRAPFILVLTACVDEGITNVRWSQDHHPPPPTVVRSSRRRVAAGLLTVDPVSLTPRMSDIVVTTVAVLPSSLHGGSRASSGQRCGNQPTTTTAVARLRAHDLHLLRCRRRRCRAATGSACSSGGGVPSLQVESPCRRVLRARQDDLTTATGEKNPTQRKILLHAS